MSNQQLFHGFRSGGGTGRSTWMRKQRCRHVSRAASGSKTSKIIPIFPLGVVALPHTDVPLQIFEARYRVLFSTLLWPRQGVEEGLVQKESQFLGSGEFGMCLSMKGLLAATGTILQIQEFVAQDDGRLLITTKGKQRFKVQDVVQEKPVLLCKVELLEDENDTTPEAKELASEVAELFRQLLRAHIRINGIKATDEQLEPEQLSELEPSALSYWVGSAFGQSKGLQQTLLEEDNTIKRLQKEKELLETQVAYMNATISISNVFKEGGSQDVPVPPPGGPD